jgi:TRAP transporter TAXI family solute receptor
MFDPDEMASRLPQWLRVVLVGFLVVLATGAGLVAYRYFTLPTTLTVAVGSIDGEAPKLMSAIASRLAATKSHVRLKVIDTGTAIEAAKTLAAGKADLAIVRADSGDLTEARTIVLVTHGVALIVVPPGSSIASVDDLKGKTVGVIGGEVNHRIVELLTSEYDLTRAKVHFKDLTPDEARRGIQSKHVAALLVVTPLTARYLSMVRGLFPQDSKKHPGLISIDSAGAIANVAKAFESYDVPKGTLRGSPPIPDDDLTTLRVPFYLVANKSLGDDAMADLAKAIMDTRRELLAEHPLLAQIAAPSTDKDAYIPVHSGAAAFYDGTQQDFFDKYSNALYYGPMLLGGLASVLVAIWKFMGIGGSGSAASPLDPMYSLAGRVRNAQSEADLTMIEEEIDNILKRELAKYSKGESQAMDAAALSLAAQRLEHLIHYRRSALEAGHPSAATT